MTATQIILDVAVVAIAAVCALALLEPVLWRRYELVAERGLRLARRGRRRIARRAAAYVLMAAEQLRDRAADTNGHHDPGPEYPILEAIVEQEMRREAREG